MIQRIQSIYLLLATIFMILTAFSPLVNIDGGITLFSLGFENEEGLLKHTWGVVSMAGLSALILLISIFSFKNRQRQITLIMFGVVFMLMFYITAIVYMTAYLGSFNASMLTMAYGLLFPIFALILSLIAIGRIKKDERLVKSLDRIR